MKNVINIVGIILLVVLTSTVNQDIMAIKPAIPKEMIVKSFQSEINSEPIALYIREKVKVGWLLKSISGTNVSTNGKSTWIVVLEKY
jgi:hypothetical protein